MTSKHPARDESPVETPHDLEENPGIGQTKGLFARAGSEDADQLAGENTVEGDVENDAALGKTADTDVGRQNP